MIKCACFLHAKPWIPDGEKNQHSRLLFTSEDRLCKNNQRIWCHNASTTSSRDVTDQLRWRHNANSENFSDNGESSNRYLFLAEMCVRDIKLRVRNMIIHLLPWIPIFRSLVMRFANDFHSWFRHSWNNWLVIPKSLSTVSHALFYISSMTLSAHCEFFAEEMC